MAGPFYIKLNILLLQVVFPIEEWDPNKDTFKNEKEKLNIKENVNIKIYKY